MWSFMKAMAISLLISIVLIGCTAEKDVTNDVGNNHTSIAAAEITEEVVSYDEGDNGAEDLEEELASDISQEEKNQEEKEKDKTQTSDHKRDDIKDTNPEVIKSNTTAPANIAENQKEEKEDLQQQKPSIETKKFKDGVYTASAMGYEGEIQLKVAVVDGKINGIEVLSHEDTPRIAANAFKLLTDNMISSQSSEVDIVTGATYSSKGFINAVQKALQ